MPGKILRFLPLVVVLGVTSFFPQAARRALDGSVVQAASTWVNVTGNLANMASECGNLTMLSAVPGSNTIMAGVALKGLWANGSGNTWSHLGTGAGSAVIINRPSWITYDSAHPGVLWESGIYSGGGIFRTMDSGNTFQQLGSISHNDYMSVDFSDPARQLLLAGGHEQAQRVYKSTNGGQTWTNIGLNLPANSNFSSVPLIIDSQTYVVNLQGWGGGISGVYRTTNGGTSWQQVSTQAPSGPPLVTSSGAIYWPFGGSLLKSINAGVTWTQVGSGLQTVTPVELPDGSLVSIGSSTLMMSTNGGTSWSTIGPSLPFPPTPFGGVIYSPNRQAFFIWHWNCGGVVLPDAVMQLDWTNTTSIPAAPTGLRIVP